MSIVGWLAADTPVITPIVPTPPATLPGVQTPDPVSLLIAAVGFIVFSLLIAWAAGVFRRRSIDGPVRLSPDRPARPLLLVTLASGMVWMIATGAVVYFVARRHGGQDLREEDLTASDYALISLVPALVGLAAVMASDAIARLRGAIGYNLARLPRGLLAGMVGAIVAVPLVNGTGNLLVVLYDWLSYKHPNEHQLLGAMKDASPNIERLLVIGACVAAPMFEEMLFRGHVQTLLVRFFAGRRKPVPTPDVPSLAGVADPALPPMPAPESSLPSPPPLSYQSPELQPSTNRHLWAAVLVTSLLFAMVHPGWMRPMIFVLSVCLGYAYERTGNLWAPITIHAAFNTLSTVVFLNVM
jgi:membrane protease YdiL (CAAX protease family)